MTLKYSRRDVAVLHIASEVARGASRTAKSLVHEF